jgi:thiol-disulfide isomerase/thioredoxin
MNIAKSGLLAIAGALLLFISTSNAGDRMVLGEMFTNTSCGPCYPADLTLDRLANDYAANFFLVRYHVWWPSSGDPYYQFNVSEATTRNNYYQNNYTPHLYIDGNRDGQELYNTWENMIINESSTSSPLSMRMWGDYNEEARTGNITVRIVTEQSPGYNNLKLRVALVENDIHWNAPNGVGVHNQTFRDMIPSAGGQGVTLVVGDTLEYTFPFSTRSPMDDSNCRLIAFVQSDQNRAVLQSSSIGIPDLSITSVDDGGVEPRAFALAQNYPNPFNLETTIDFISSGGKTSLEIFDISGARVVTLLNKNLGAGQYSLIWDGRDQAGKQVTSGTYFYRLSDAAGSQTRRMTLLK